MTIAITPFYAASVLFIYLALSMRVIEFRRTFRIYDGDEGNPSLIRRMRAQANCAEYAPIGLVLLLMLELQGWPPLFVHALGACLLLGRASHAYGVIAKPINFTMRNLGMLLTFAQIIATCALLVVRALM